MDDTINNEVMETRKQEVLDSRNVEARIATMNLQLSLMTEAELEARSRPRDEEDAVPHDFQSTVQNLVWAMLFEFRRNADLNSKTLTAVFPFDDKVELLLEPGASIWCPIATITVTRQRYKPETVLWEAELGLAWEHIERSNMRLIGRTGKTGRVIASCGGTTPLTGKEALVFEKENLLDGIDVQNFKYPTI